MTASINGNFKIVGSGGGTITQLSPNISWEYSANPYNFPGSTQLPGVHIACLSNNATIMQTCCGFYREDFVTVGGNTTTNVTSPQGYINWCTMTFYEAMVDGYPPAPLGVKNFEGCFNRTVDPSRDVGKHYSNLTQDSNVWQCEVTGLGQGTASYGRPFLAVSATSGGGGEKLGVKGKKLTVGLAVVGACMGVLGHGAL